jgi:hypothetical protein
MTDLRVSKVPEELHRRVRRNAEKRGLAIRDVVLEAVRREMSRQDFLDRLLSREPVDLGVSAARLLDEARAEIEGRIDT